MTAVCIILAILVLVATPFLAKKRTKLGSKTKGAVVSAMAAFFLFVVAAMVSALSQDAMAAEEVVTTGAQGLAQGWGFIAASLTTLGSCVGSGIAVASAASAALGAISENEKIFGKALIMVALAESIALYGLLISIMIINKL